MYRIIFYEKSGKSELWNFLETLREQSATNKDSRIQYKQLLLYIQLLQENGRNLPENISKHLENGIWELRPGNNRILFFFWDGEACILLHHFRKKTQKTPRRELEKAEREMMDFLNRKELMADENME
ncbi:MAG: type II toxin-antitoxin system RelE/ParE family toxin [Firmicutes bacterium]|nr:type II toxin-antitoxin system RelE/ParE family toxin [Bacillota bacterium]